MTFELTPTWLQRLSQYFDLGAMRAPPLAIAGGKLHQVWRLSTEKGDYALKRLDINTSPAVVVLYRETQKIARQFQQHNIPVVTAHRHKGNPVCILDDNYFMLFDWLDGEKIAPQKAMPLHAAKMGALLAQLHHVNLSAASFNTSILNDEFCDHAFSSKKWQDLVARAVVRKITHAAKLAATLPLILEVCEQAEQATQLLKSQRIISHRDASPNNVIWHNHYSPIIIDWELAGLIHPTVDLLGGAFDWSIVTADEVSLERFKAFISAYQTAGGRSDNISAAFNALMGIWFSWMELNLQRFVDDKTAALRNLGEREAMHTLLAFHTVYPERDKYQTLVADIFQLET